MAPEVLVRKLAYLRQLLVDMEFYQDATLAEVREQHYALERIFELLVMTASDILFHLLGERNIHPASYRESFALAADEGLLPPDLADRLSDAAGMRNIIVHMYETLDYALLHDSIRPALEDFSAFVAACASLAEEPEQD